MKAKHSRWGFGHRRAGGDIDGHHAGRRDKSLSAEGDTTDAMRIF